MDSEKYKISVIGHTKKDGRMHYIINFENNNENFSFLERYSGLRGLNDAMKKYINKPNFPKFPPKKFFGSEEEKFIIKRQQEINKYFDIICKDPDFITLPPLIKFLEDKRSKKNINDKEEQIKKENIRMKENELKKSIKSTEKDYEKIAKELNKQFYNMNKNYFDKNLLKENKNGIFIKFFKNNKINIDEIDTKLDKGDDKNFGFINNGENLFKNIEVILKNKYRKFEELFESFNDIYNSNGILVPI